MQRTRAARRALVAVSILARQAPLVVVGLLAVVVGAADAFGLLDNFAWLSQRVPQLTLVLVGMIAFYLVFDHIKASAIRRDIVEGSERIRTSIRSIESALSSALPSSSQLSADDVYRAAGRVVLRSERMVRATSFGVGGLAQFTTYLQVLARHAKARSEQGRPFFYKVVMGSRDFDPRVIDKIASRTAAFAENGVPDLMSIRCLKDGPPWGLDLLIVDDKHLMVVFLQHHTDELQHAITIMNNAEVVGPIADWYDELLYTRCAVPWSGSLDSASD